MEDGHLGYIKRFLKKNHLVRPGVHLLCYIAHTIYTIPRVTVVGQSEPTIVGQLLIFEFGLVRTHVVWVLNQNQAQFSPKESTIINLRDTYVDIHLKGYII